MDVTISELKALVIKAEKGIEQETAKIILKFEQEILDLVREKQLYDKGIDGTGAYLQPYKDITVWIKQNSKGGHDKKTSNTTLKDTGSFYKSFQTDYGSFELEVFSTDSKTKDITDKYGENIFLITEQNQSILSEKIIRPNLIKYFKGIFK